MPEMDGCEATVHIRSATDNPNQECPIIALTAAALLDEKNRALDSGMNDFLTKPFSPGQLKQLILKWGGGHTDRQKSFAETKPFDEHQESIEINLDYLKNISKDDIQFVSEMIHIFINEIPPAIKKLHLAHEKEEWSTVCGIAHRIKSNYMMVGMDIERQIALQIEKSIKEDNYKEEELKQWIRQLDIASNLAYPLLEKELKTLSPVKICPVTGAKLG